MVKDKKNDFEVKSMSIHDLRDMIWWYWCWDYMDMCEKHPERPIEINRRLSTASNVCFDCGKKYWNTKDCHVWVRFAKCDICWNEDYCAAPRDFNYFM